MFSRPPPFPPPFFRRHTSGSEYVHTPAFLLLVGNTWRSEKLRRPREAVAPYVQLITEALADDNDDLEFVFCGSWRRGAELVGDLDVLCLTESEFTANLFDGGINLPCLPGLTYQRRGPRLAAAELALPDGPLHLDYWQFPPSSRGPALLALTGPASFNKACRIRAARCRPSLALSQQALKVRDTGQVVDVPDEAAVLAAIGMRYESPEQRQRWAAVRL
jgi:DNA polymerase/3'-5' exonuclease PolX